MKPMVLYKYKVVNNSDTQYLSYELYTMYHTDEKKLENKLIIIIL